MCLQNESIDLYTLKTMHAICRELGNASFIQKIQYTHSYSYFYIFLLLFSYDLHRVTRNVRRYIVTHPEKHCNYL